MIQVWYDEKTNEIVESDFEKNEIKTKLDDGDWLVTTSYTVPISELIVESGFVYLGEL
jgi:hypothetical protein